MFQTYSCIISLLDEVGKVALATIVAVEVHGHEDSRAAELVRALAAETCDLVIGIDLVELQHSEFDLLALVLDLLWLGVSFLFALLATTGELRGHEEGGLIGNAASPQNVTVRQGAAAEEKSL